MCPSRSRALFFLSNTPNDHYLDRASPRSLPPSMKTESVNGFHDCKAPAIFRGAMPLAPSRSRALFFCPRQRSGGKTSPRL